MVLVGTHGAHRHAQPVLFTFPSAAPLEGHANAAPRLPLRCLPVPPQLQVQSAHWQCARTALAMASPFSMPALGFGYGPMQQDDGGLEEEEEEDDDNDNDRATEEGEEEEGSSEEGQEEEGSSEEGPGFERGQHRSSSSGAPLRAAEPEGKGPEGVQHRWSVPQPPLPTAGQAPAEQLARAAAHAAAVARPRAARRHNHAGPHAEGVQQQGEGRGKGRRKGASAWQLALIRKKVVRAFWRRHAARVGAALQRRG